MTNIDVSTELVAEWPPVRGKRGNGARHAFVISLVSRLCACPHPRGQRGDPRKWLDDVYATVKDLDAGSGVNYAATTSDVLARWENGGRLTLITCKGFGRKTLDYVHWVLFIRRGVEIPDPS